MNASALWRMGISTIPTAIGTVFCAALLFAFLKNKSRLSLFFFCFYLTSVLNLAGASITSMVLNSPISIDIRTLWTISSAIAKLRFIFLILFAHSIHRFRAAPFLTGVLFAVVMLGIAAPFFIYSIIPSLTEIFVVLYVFFYLLTVYLKRADLSIPPRLLELLRAILTCSGFFLIGVILDLLEDIPQASIYFSLWLIDFYPPYLVCIGGVMVFWSLRDIFHPESSRAPEVSLTFHRAPIAVTKREKEIIDLILRGETNASIADRLFISESTVKKHVNNIFKKLKITSRWELLKLTGYVHPKA